MALKRMGFQNQLVAHGLRSLASTALNEHGFDLDVIEAALAHTGKNEVRNAYNRAYILKGVSLLWPGGVIILKMPVLGILALLAM